MATGTKTECWDKIHHQIRDTNTQTYGYQNDDGQQKQDKNDITIK